MTDSGQPSDLLKRLRRGDNEAFERLYALYYRSAAAFVKANSGNEQDARDLFQEALLVLFKRTRDAGFQLTADPGAFLQAVVRKMWLYQLRTQQAHPETRLDDQTPMPDPGADELELLFRENTASEKQRAVQQLLQTLKTECQKLIEYVYYCQYTTGEMAALLGYAESFIKVKKHRCMEALRKKVKDHPAFNHE